MHHVAIGLGVALLSVSWPAAARGDGGTLREWKRQGNYEIAVFTDPTPFVAGPVDISVLLLDPATGEPIPDARVTVDVAPRGRPDMATHHPATKGSATNKLLYAAVFDLRLSGRCEVKVAVDRPDDRAEIRFGLEVAGHSTPRSGLLLWILWPVPVIAVYGVHRGLVGRKHRPKG